MAYTVDQVVYDAAGRVTSTRLPAVGGLPAQTVQAGFNRFGQQLTLGVLDAGASSARSVITGVDYDNLGRLERRSYAGGVERSIAWDPVRGVPLSMTAEKVSGGSLVYQQDAFVRDDAGRLTGVTTTGNAGFVESQCFVYDGFNRLQSAWTFTGAATSCGSTMPAASSTDWQVGAASYRAEWEYSASGKVEERVTQGHTGSAPTAEVTHTYGYEDEDPGDHPHAAVSVTDGTDTTAYAYDGAGRMTDRVSTVSAEDLELQWDVLSNLVGTTGAGGDVLYLYDASGQRVAHIDTTSDEATVFLGDTQATDADTTDNGTTAGAGPGMSATRYFTHGGATVALARATWTSGTQPAPSWFFLFGDHQGSAQLLVDAADPTQYTRTAYTPYGAERGAPAGPLTPGVGTTNLGVDRGWLAQVNDGDIGETAATGTGTGLTYLNARYYDTTLARFISPDPLMDPTDPRTLDPYRYADNNPVIFMDPTGLTPGYSGTHGCAGVTGYARAACVSSYRNISAYNATMLKIQKAADYIADQKWIAEQGRHGFKNRLRQIGNGYIALANLARQGSMKPTFDADGNLTGITRGPAPQYGYMGYTGKASVQDPALGFNEKLDLLTGAVSIAGGITSLVKRFSKKGAPTTVGVPGSTQETIQAAANRASSNVGPGVGAVHGTNVHTELSAQIRALNRNDIHSEVSYLNGRVVDYGTPGSVRLDVVTGDKWAPTSILDLKTGSARLTPARVDQIRSHLPRGYQNIPINELRATG